MIRQQRSGQSPGKSTLTQDAGPAAGPGKRTRVEECAGAAQIQGALVAEPPPASGGRALPAPLQRTMGAALGADFSGVSVHVGERARSLGALAYAQGEQLHFAPGQYDPSSEAGQRLIGHELAHVVQQRQGRAQAGAPTHGMPISEDPALEREADERGARAARGEHGDGPLSDRPGSDGPVTAPVIQGYFATNRGTAMLVHNPAQPMEGETRWLENHAQLEKLQEAIVSDLAWVRVQVTTGTYRGKEGWLLASWITEYQEPRLGGELAEFRTKLWEQRPALLSNEGLPMNMNPHRVKIERIYKALYERGDDDRSRKQPLQRYSSTVEDMVKVANRHGGKLQFPVMVPGVGSLDDLAKLWACSRVQQSPGTKPAYDALLYGAYYCTLQHGESTGRIVFNVGPGKVVAAFDAACQTARKHPSAVAVKAFGPGECLRKLDSLLVYVRQGDDLQALVEALRQQGLPDGTVTPMMTETIAQGMAFAQEPLPLGQQQISFGQKRCILGYVALREASDPTDCERTLADLFRRAGIDLEHPARETGPAEPDVASLLSSYLSLLS
jgi:hypothetical protein